MAKQGGSGLGMTRTIIAIILLQMAVLFLYDTKNYMTDLVHKERSLNRAVIGAESEARMKDKANAMFTSIFISTGLYGATQSWADTTGSINRADLEAYSRNWLKRQLDSVWMLVWVMSYRTIGILTWMLFAIPLIVAMFADALLYREIRKWRYELTSPFTQNLHEKISQWLAGALIYLPFAPIPMPSWITPLAFMLVAFMTRGVFANMQKRI
jgi:hypothetical protein